jgi:very-short-patch-repair endonuclease
MTRANVRAIEELLQRATSEPRLFLRSSPSPWTNAELRDREAVEDAVELASHLSATLLPALQQETDALVKAVQVERPTTLSSYGGVLDVIDRANQILQTYRPEVFQSDSALLAKQLEAAKGPVSAVWASLTNSQYRQATGYLGSLRYTKARPSQLLADLSLIQGLGADWARLAPAGVFPTAYPNQNKLANAVQAVQVAAAALGRYLILPTNEDPIGNLAELVQLLASDRLTPVKLPAVRGYEAELIKLGAGPIVLEIKARSLPVDAWVPQLRFAWLAACVDQLLLEEPELAIFNGREHDKIVAEFKDLDRQRLEVADDRVRRAYAEAVVSAANQFPDEYLLVKRQAALRSRHLPFRELTRRAPHVVTAVKPCWMASPLAVSQLLGRPEQFFDVVIFDEASQVLPEDAVTSILRGKSVVVAGDPNQLPPSPFFAAEREEDESEPAEEMEGFESILDVMLAFLPQWSLDWHYRSHDERLIAFSNHYIYDDRLVTFPSPGSEDPALTHILVDQTAGGDSQELSSSPEVARVVQLILDHAQHRPNESLGVIAMGIKHSNRIQAELIRTRRGRPELDGFFDAHPDEKFFVKNLERVQGDERDSIILSIGYGKDSSGTLPYRFGPLLNEGGHRRLNVAVTRAKRRATLVSSFSHLDMDPGRSSKKGVELLRLYLEYAASGGEVFGDGGPTTVERNEFEIQVQLALEREGLLIKPQFGASRYRIDMVVQHPDQPGRQVLAIECDGASYHSSPTARDRDRLRQEHLEARGWRFVRIWSTDWFARPDEEVARVMEAYARSLASNPHMAQGPKDAGPHPLSTEALQDPSSAPRPSRDPRPAVPRQLAITEYSIKELATIARWIQSDGLLRTDEELVTAMMADLGFARRARRIEAALRQAITLSKS